MTKPDDTPAQDPHGEDKATDGYEVGYGKPPKGHQFKKGRSGNPNGRPKNTKNLVTIFDQELDRPILIKENGQTHKITKRQALARSLVNGSIQGDATCRRLLMRHLNDNPQADAFTAAPEDQQDLSDLLKHIIEDTSSNDDNI